jgi:hypothetical protein
VLDKENMTIIALALLSQFNSQKLEFWISLKLHVAENKFVNIGENVDGVHKGECFF